MEEENAEEDPGSMTARRSRRGDGDDGFEDFDNEDPMLERRASGRAAASGRRSWSGGRGREEEEEEYWPMDDRDASRDPMGGMEDESGDGYWEDIADGDQRGSEFAAEGVFEGMDEEDEEDEDEELSLGVDGQELSLLYDDFQVKGKKPRPDATEDGEEDNEKARTGVMKEKADSRGHIRQKPRRRLESLEEREYVVSAEGIAVRTLPDERSPRTGEILRQGETFTAIESVDGEDKDQRLYLRLPDGRGWVFDDERIFPGLPSVKLLSIGGISVEEEGPAPVQRPVVAVVGRPNVGKSTLVNRICDIPDTSGNITFDSPGVTRDRTYKLAQHTDDCGDSYLFEVVDTGGLMFFDDPDTVTFANEIKTQIDVALREAVACILVVDSQAGLTGEDQDIARYIKKNYVPRGLKVVVAVAKCDRLETMDLNTAEFWALDLGEPIPISSVHGRGVWEVTDKIVDRGSEGVFPMKIRGEEPPPSIRDGSVSVAMVGKPNAGKSSLLNALIGEARSIVSDTPGTTTDSIDAYLETREGKVYRFIDTAGIRRTGRIKPGTEWLSVNRAIKSVKRADVALMLLDASEIMTGNRTKGLQYWCPDNQQRYIARRIEEAGTACVIVLTKWDAVPNKDEKTLKRFTEAIRSNLAGVGQWAEILACSSVTGQRLRKVVEAVDKTLEAHTKRVPSHTLNEVVRDALLWRLPAAKAFNKKQGRIYYACQVSAEPPVITLFCNNPKLFGANYKTYLENKLRQDLGWFGTPVQLEWRKRSERRAVSQAEQWLTPRLQPEAVWR